MEDFDAGGFEGVVEEVVAAFAVIAGVGFVVELDDELYFERGGIAEDEVDGFAVDFVLQGLLPRASCGAG